MRIEKLEPSHHREGRWLVWFEDGSLVRLGESEVLSLGIYSGKELTEEEADLLMEASRQSEMNQRAVRLLTARPMSRKELVEKLTVPPRQKRQPGESREPDPGTDSPARERQKEELQAAAWKTADRMEELGLLNDREYAGNVVRYYAEKGYGVRKLRDELFRRGIPEEFWEEALAETEPDEARLDAVLNQRLRGAEPSRENLKKASDFLSRRGYRWEEISEALGRYRERWEMEYGNE